MTRKIQLHQWPNVLALDAALIAIAWQAALAASVNVTIEWPASAILGLSVWLTYLADRLFDVGQQAHSKFVSLRHRFAKKNKCLLWGIWWGALVINLGLATRLNAYQIKRGFILLAICLLYTFLNQKLSRRFFPKEICVAIIFTAGVVIFIPAHIPLSLSLALAWLCLLNCLVIGVREKEVDAQMQVHSIAPLLVEHYLLIAAFVSAIAMARVQSELSLTMAFCAVAMASVHFYSARLKIENFRVLVDAILLFGAVFALWHIR